ncbi:MAG: hypothetical protein ABUL44_04565, partial [Flavobacterium sp.]
DIELIVRIFALSTNIRGYEKPMNEFVNIMTKKYKNSDAAVVKAFLKNFPIACDIIQQNLRQKPFNVRGPLNTSVLDSVFSVIINNITKIPKDLNKRYEKLLTDKTFEDYTTIGTTDTKTVKERFAYVKTKLID